MSVWFERFKHGFILSLLISIFYPLGAYAIGNSIVAVDNAANVGQYTSLALDSVGNPVMSYYDATNGKLKVAHCFEKNCSLFNAIVTPDASSQIGQYTALTLDTSGNPVISYYDQANSALKVLHCGNSSCLSGNTIATPDAVGTVGQYTAITVDNLNKPVVSYYDATNGKLKILHCGNASCSAGNTLATPDTTSSNGVQSSIKLNALGNPIVAYFDFTHGSLKLLICGNGSCTVGNSITTLDASANVGRYPSLVLDSAGKPVISYLDLTNGKLKVLRCGNTLCSMGNTITTPDMSATVGYFSSLRLDSVDNPVISYYDSTNGNLKTLHCGNATCTSNNTITAPDTAGTTGQYTSLALDTAGNPVVSYYDATNGDLKVLHCASPSCGPNTISVPDTSGNVGQYSSLKLDGLGNPVVSYWDETNGDLKLLHCGDATCSGGNTITSPDVTNNTGWDTSLALDSFDNPVVGYYDFTGSVMKILHCNDVNCLGMKSIVSPDSLSHRHASMALDASGHPVVATAGSADQGLRVVHCGDTTCTNNNTLASPDVPGFPFQSDVRAVSLTLDSSGNPVVSFYRQDQQQLKILHCSDATCSLPTNSLTVPDASARTPTTRATSIAMDASGNPVLAYYDSATNSLKILHCGNSNCTSSNSIQTPVVGDATQMFPSLKLDAAGNPVVSYSANSGLKLLYCGDANCSSGNTITNVDAVGSVGWYSSLALDTSGKPVISYYFSNTKKLKVVHCATATCQ